MLAPSLKLKQLLIHMACGERLEAPDEIANRLDELRDGDELGEVEYELRRGTEATGLPCAHSRHYESKAVAAQMLDGSWVGWTYWYGGGKHGEPRGVPWIEDAYNLNAREETRIVRVFSIPGKA